MKRTRLDLDSSLFDNYKVGTRNPRKSENVFKKTIFFQKKRKINLTFGVFGVIPSYLVRIEHILWKNNEKIFFDEKLFFRPQKSKLYQKYFPIFENLKIKIFQNIKMYFFIILSFRAMNFQLLSINQKHKYNY